MSITLIISKGTKPGFIRFFSLLILFLKINFVFSSNFRGLRNCDAGVAIAVPANTSGHCNCGAGVAVAAPTQLINYSNYLSVYLKNGKFDQSVCLSNRSDGPYLVNLVVKIQIMLK